MSEPAPQTGDSLDRADGDSLGAARPVEAQLAFLARELGRVQTALARLTPPAEPSESSHEGGLAAALRDVAAAVDGIARALVNEAATACRERQEMCRILEALREEVAGLRAGGPFARPSRTEVPHEERRVGVFVDVQNVFYAAKQFNARLDFGRLLEVGSAGRRLVRAIAYVVQSPEVDQSGFLSMLHQKGYEVRRKDLRTRADGSSKGDWDMGMAIDIMGLVDRLDVIVLVTGDGDFVSLVNLVKTIGPRVELVSFRHNTARDLIESADCYTPVEDELMMPAPNHDRSVASLPRPADPPPPDPLDSPRP